MSIRQYFYETNYILFHKNVKRAAETALLSLSRLPLLCSWRHVGLIDAYWETTK